jgi:SNF2 family DNA or RNA helicase
MSLTTKNKQSEYLPPLMPRELVATTPQLWEPHPYQKSAVEWLAGRSGAGLFLDPGLGKTSIVLKTISVLKSRDIITKPVLVIAPLRVCYNVWPLEKDKWVDFCDLSIGVLHGPRKEKVLTETHDIYVINPEGLDWLAREDRFKKLGADTLVVDESSKFKHTQTQRFKIIKPWLPTFKRRWILTGTPASNGLLDLFGQVYIVDLGESFTPFITHYKRNYFEQTGYGGYTWFPKVDAQERIYDCIKDKCLRLSEEQYLALPDLINNNVYVDLPEKARKIYSQMELELWAEIDGVGVNAVSAAAASIKCRQIANGGLYMGDGDTRNAVSIHSAKTEAVEEIVEELNGQPVLIGYEFQHDLARLKAAFPKAEVIGGGTSPKETDRIVRLWNTGQLPILLGHPAAMGHGLNLQSSGGAIIWHSLTWDLELYEQFVRRIYRQGNKAAKVVVHRVVAKNTIDMVVLKALTKKRGIQGALLNALREYRNGGA